MRAAALDLGPDGIRVNAIAPSVVKTEGTQEFFGAKYEGALDVIRTGQTLQRNLEVDDVVGTGAWLLSDASTFITGQTIAVDGGTVFA